MRRAVHLDLVWKHGHRKPLIPVHEDEVTAEIIHLVGHGPLAAPRQVSLHGTEQLAGVAAKPSMRTVEHRVLLSHLTNCSSLEGSNPRATSLPAARAGQTEGFCRKVDSNILLPTTCGIFNIQSFPYVVWFINFATERSLVPPIREYQLPEQREEQKLVGKWVAYHRIPFLYRSNGGILP